MAIDSVIIEDIDIYDTKRLHVSAVGDEVFLSIGTSTDSFRSRGVKVLDKGSAEVSVKAADLAHALLALGVLVGFEVADFEATIELG